MTLFVVVFSTLNIAIGYALAVYLGHGELPWQIGTSAYRLRSKKPAPSPPDCESEAVAETTESWDETDYEEEELDQQFEPAEQIQAEPLGAQEQPTEHASETEEKEVAAATSASDEETASPAAEEATNVQSANDIQARPLIPEPETAAKVAAVTAPIEAEDVTNDAPSQEVLEHATEKLSAGDPTDASPAVEPVAPAAADSSQELGTGASPAGQDEALDDKFLEGIAAFQSQLEQHKESTPDGLEAETEGEESILSKAASPISEKASGESPPQSTDDDVLAGIEAFRAQLAGMHQDEKPAADAAKQPVG